MLLRRLGTGFLCTLLLLPGGVRAHVGVVTQVASVYFPRAESQSLHEQAHQRARQIVRDFNHCCVSFGQAEVIGWNRGYADPIEAVVQGWQRSPGHDAILRDSDYMRIGCSYIIADDPREPGPDTTYFFACVLDTGEDPTSSPPQPTAPVVTVPDTAMPE